MKKRLSQSLPLICLLVAVALVSSTATLLLTDARGIAPERAGAPEKYDRLEEVLSIVERDYYVEPDEDALLTGAVRGLLDSLDDPYTYYYSAEEMAEMQEETTGVYYGVGMLISMTESGALEVLRVFRDSPAKEAGVLPGDEIVAISGEKVSGEDGKQLSDAVGKIRGGEGSQVSLTLRRGDQLLDVSMPRSEVSVNHVEYEILDGNIGYLSLYQFSGDDVTGFAEAIAAFQSAGTKGFVVDLRANPGGFLDDVVKICDMVLDEGLIVYTEDRQGRREDYYADDTFWDAPMVVLVDGMSASASEIFAAAVQDTGRGLIVGETTYGKGVVQTLLTFQDGDGMQLTTSSYFTPSGRSIHGNGVTPDIEVAQTGDVPINYYAADPENDAQLKKALEALNGLIALREEA